MDKQIEIKEQQTKPEIVGIGDEFQLFNPKRESLNLEEPGVISSLPINVDTFAGNVWLKVGINPFNPAIGYQIDNEDFNIETRTKKVQKARETEQGINNSFYLYIKVGPLEAAEPSPALKNLRLQLIFPAVANDQRFEGDSDFDTSSKILTFSLFYPLDTGPLPEQKYDQDKHQSAVPQGHQIFLPKDMNKLSQIKAKFVLVDDNQDIPNRRS